MSEHAGIAQAVLKVRPNQIYSWGGFAFTAIGLLGFLGMSAAGVDGQNVEPFHGLVVAIIGMTMQYFGYTVAKNAQISEQIHESKMSEKRKNMRTTHPMTKGEKAFLIHIKSLSHLLPLRPGQLIDHVFEYDQQVDKGTVQDRLFSKRLAEMNYRGYMVVIDGQWDLRDNEQNLNATIIQ